MECILTTASLTLACRMLCPPCKLREPQNSTVKDMQKVLDNSHISSKLLLNCSKKRLYNKGPRRSCQTVPGLPVHWRASQHESFHCRPCPCSGRWPPAWSVGPAGGGASPSWACPVWPQLLPQPLLGSHRPQTQIGHQQKTIGPLLHHSQCLWCLVAAHKMLHLHHVECL